MCVVVVCVGGATVMRNIMSCCALYGSLKFENKFLFFNFY